MSTPPPGNWRPRDPQAHPTGQYDQRRSAHLAPHPRRPSRCAKFLVGGLAVLAVVVVTVVTTLLLTHEGTGLSAPSTRTAQSPPTDSPGIASVDGVQPLGVITYEPTCTTWIPINDSLAAAQQNGWQNRDPSVPASVWSPQQRNDYAAVAKAFHGAADRAIALANQTPHRAVRNIYEQFAAYAQAYARSIPLYEPTDDHLARATIGASLAINSICNAIEYGSASARAPLAKPTAPAVSEAPPSSGNNPDRFITAWTSACSDWVSLVHTYSADIADWQSSDPKISAPQWDARQKAINASAIPVMESFAETATEISVSNNNSALRDMAVLAAQYRRTFAASIPTYTSADNYLNEAATGLTGAIYEACKAVAAS